MKTYECAKCYHCGKLHEAGTTKFITLHGKAIRNVKESTRGYSEKICEFDEAGSSFCTAGCLHNYLVKEKMVEPHNQYNMFGQKISR